LGARGIPSLFVRMVDVDGWKEKSWMASIHYLFSHR